MYNSCGHECHQLRVGGECNRCNDKIDKKMENEIVLMPKAISIGEPRVSFSKQSCLIIFTLKAIDKVQLHDFEKFAFVIDKESNELYLKFMPNGFSIKKKPSGAKNGSMKHLVVSRTVTKEIVNYFGGEDATAISFLIGERQRDRITFIKNSLIVR